MDFSEDLRELQTLADGVVSLRRRDIRAGLAKGSPSEESTLAQKRLDSAQIAYNTKLEDAMLGQAAVVARACELDFTVTNSTKVEPSSVQAQKGLVSKSPPREVLEGDFIRALMQGKKYQTRVIIAAFKDATH